MFRGAGTVLRLRPDLPRVSAGERLRSCAGALAGIALTGFVTRLVLPASGDLPLLIAPIGASAVLLFAVPASPLAQPWSILGGNTIAAIIGVTCRTWFADPFIAAAVACGWAIGVMFLLDCLHPPGGAVALTAVLGGPAVESAGFGFALAPVALNSALLLAIALAFNNIGGRRYPHLRTSPANVHHTADPMPTSRVGVTASDVDAVLRQRDELLDVSPGDVEAIVHEAELLAYRRRFGELTCEAIMSRDVASVTPATPPRAAWELLLRHRIKALPVLDGDRRIVGIVTQTDFMDLGPWPPRMPADAALPRMARRLGWPQRDARTVAGLMTSPVHSVPADTPIARLVPAMADAGLHHVPVVDEAGRLAGIVTQSDLVAALYRGAVAR